MAIPLSRNWRNWVQKVSVSRRVKCMEIQSVQWGLERMESQGTASRRQKPRQSFIPSAALHFRHCDFQTIPGHTPSSLLFSFSTPNTSAQLGFTQDSCSSFLWFLLVQTFFLILAFLCVCCKATTQLKWFAAAKKISQFFSLALTPPFPLSLSHIHTHTHTHACALSTLFFLLLLFPPFSLCFCLNPALFVLFPALVLKHRKWSNHAGFPFQKNPRDKGRGANSR